MPFRGTKHKVQFLPHSIKISSIAPAHHVIFSSPLAAKCWKLRFDKTEGMHSPYVKTERNYPWDMILSIHHLVEVHWWKGKPWWGWSRERKKGHLRERVPRTCVWITPFCKIVSILREGGKEAHITEIEDVCDKQWSLWYKQQGEWQNGYDSSLAKTDTNLCKHLRVRRCAG